MRMLLARVGRWVRSLAAPPPVEAVPPPVAAIEANERGRRADEAGDRETAEAAYVEAARLAPRWVSPWFNLGILYKLTARWEDAAEACRRALDLDPASEGASWNLGIAATALGDWPEARRAWRACGLAFPDGDGPLDLRLGPVPIRVSVSGAPEVVWCDRLDPARAVVRSVPTPESGRRHGDLVLHDGAPSGWRFLGDREVPVFDELALLAPSRTSTFVVEVDVPTLDDSRALEAALSARGLIAEDWTMQVRMLCRACSEGRPHAAGDDHRPAEQSWMTRHRVGIAARDDAGIRAALAEWASGRPERAHGGIERAVSGVLPA